MSRSLIFSLMLSLPFASFAKEDVAVFAGGCFWCVEADFDKLPGVISTTSGFDGGQLKNPTYEKVSSGTTQYVESVKVVFDPDKVSYKELLDYFFRHIDPTSKNGQFCDRGPQYRSVIFYLNEAQKQSALQALEEVKKRFPVVYTEVLPSTQFYPAEAYHQNYYQKHAIKYRYYRYRCGRDARVKEVWEHEQN